MLPAPEDDVKTFERFVVSRSQVSRVRETFSHRFNVTQTNPLHSRPLGCVCGGVGERKESVKERRERSVVLSLASTLTVGSKER